MSIPLKGRRDGNEASIVNALLQVGASVTRLSSRDVPDLAVGFRHLNYFMEIKRPGGKPRPGQLAWAQQWKGQYALVCTAAEALAVLGI